MIAPRRDRVEIDAEPDELFRRLPGPHRFRFASGPGRPHVMGAAPRAVVDARSRPGREERALERAHFADVLPRLAAPSAGDVFPGGAVGFVGYERGAPHEDVRAHALDRPGPDLWFGVYDTFAIAPDGGGPCEIVSWGLTEDGETSRSLAARRTAELRERLEAPASPGSIAPLPSAGAPVVSLDRAAHARGVERILDHITRGDIYQANLTVRFDRPLSEAPDQMFARLLRDNPAPYSAYVEADDAAVVSCSPERLLRVRGRDVECRPIKGTASRGADAVTDRRRAQTLLGSAKDRAELLMITDLVRNDLGKVCDFGTVRVPSLVDVESFVNVHHLVSTVRGTLRSGLDLFDAFDALYPFGSITGAPKRRAMEILRDLEPVARDVYTGAVGWIGFDGSADFSVAIRTGVAAGGRFRFGAGGGIVIDSDPDAEWAELEWKARAFVDALTAGAPRPAGAPS